MSRKYKFNNKQGIYFVSFSAVAVGLGMRVSCTNNKEATTIKRC